MGNRVRFVVNGFQAPNLPMATGKTDHIVGRAVKRKKEPIAKVASRPRGNTGTGSEQRGQSHRDVHSESNEAIHMVQPQSSSSTIDIPLREFYVYALIDPRDGNIFYVGKGKRERILHHAGQVVISEAFTDRDDSEVNPCGDQSRTEKEQRITEIKMASLDVIERVLARFNTEAEAFAVESVLIHWVYGRKQEGDRKSVV